jgi:hypothetical protein
MAELDTTWLLVITKKRMKITEFIIKQAQKSKDSAESLWE